MSGTARLIGVGVGPGDPELMTLKAVRALGEADVVAYFAKAGNAQQRPRASPRRYLRPGAVELPLLYPVTTEIAKDDAGLCDGDRGVLRRRPRRRVAAHLDAGRTVAVLSRGRPVLLRLLHASARPAQRRAIRPR